jgi:hypothetical protein
MIDSLRPGEKLPDMAAPPGEIASSDIFSPPTNRFSAAKEACRLTAAVISQNSWASQSFKLRSPARNYMIAFRTPFVDAHINKSRQTDTTTNGGVFH